MATFDDKVKNLKKHKRWATGLFCFMLLVYIASTLMLNNYHWSLLGYINAFSEAAMVGALADWFAVTALFNHPFGIKIPHTNIIQKSQRTIGDNLGKFVVDNFLNPSTIKPYVAQLTLTSYLLTWLEEEKNRILIIKELKFQLNNVISHLDPNWVNSFMEQQTKKGLEQWDLPATVSKVLQFMLQREEYDTLLSQLLKKVAQLVRENDGRVHKKVQEQSYFFVPHFLNNKIADKMVAGIISFLNEVAEDAEHPVRKEIYDYLWNFSKELTSQPKWDKELRHWKQELLESEQLRHLLHSIRLYISDKLNIYLSADDVTLEQKISPMILKWKNTREQNKAQQKQVDLWINKKIYKLLLSHTNTIAQLITNTVNKWDGKELSTKLEVEIGKDLQFIRINGTLVGGLVGLLLHTLTELFLR